jgi:cellulose synthase/poly-beta-1,6-N-acetylglucosamine synthase-like glycosyltransferase
MSNGETAQPPRRHVFGARVEYSERVVISIGVFAFNEAGSIGPLLDALVEQELGSQLEVEIIVVSFGSTDGTDGIVTERARRDRRIRLESHPVCQGKAASVNRFLRVARGEVLVILSGDSEVRSRDAIRGLVEPLIEDPTIGCVGARHRVSNPGRGGFVAFAGERVWSTLHLVSSVEPKVSGDLMAIRAGVVGSLPAGLLNDDAYLEIACRQRGLSRLYRPEVEVFIRIPETLRDYLVQRRRIYGGHAQLERLFPEFQLSTNRLGLLVRLMLRQVTSPRTLEWSVLLMALDAAVRGQARLDDLSSRYQGGRWPVIHTTKVRRVAGTRE